MRSGISHVICIKQNETVFEVALIFFSEKFYYKLYIEKMTICEAFVETKNAMREHQEPEIKEEAHKFLLIRPSDSYDS